MTKTHMCPKCQGPMEEGFIPDASARGWELTRWVQGKPDVSPWFGGLRGAWELGAESTPVVTWRCTQCGYLESYAQSQEGEAN